MTHLIELQKRAIEIRRKYSEKNLKDGHNNWSGKEYAMGLVGDVGDLIKLVMAKENLRHVEDVDHKLAHELSDCLWAVLVLSNHYGVNLEETFLQTMEELEQRIIHEN